jgi:HEAT repeat protein
MEDELQLQLERLEDDDAVERGRAAEVLGELARSGSQPRAVDGLVRLQLDPDVIVRFKAARELAWLGDDRGLEALVWALSRKELCFVSLEALTQLGSRSSLEPVRRFFRKWFLHPLERIQAAAALHRCGDEEGTDFLRSRLNSNRPEERGFALELWGKLKMEGALDLLQGVLSDNSDPHRLDAVRGLGHLGDKRSLPLLDRISRQRDDELLAQTAGEAARAVRDSNQ